MGRLASGGRGGRESEIDVLEDFAPVVDVGVEGARHVGVWWINGGRDVQSVDDEVDMATVGCGMHLFGYVEAGAFRSEAVGFAVVCPDVEHHAVRVGEFGMVAEGDEAAGDFRHSVSKERVISTVATSNTG